MICITEKYGPFHIKRVWFNNSLECGCTLLRQMRIDEPSSLRTARNELSYTVISDLTVDKEDLLANARKTVRNEIRRAEKDGLSLSFFDSEKLSKHPEIVEEFESAYKKFAEQLQNETVKAAYQRKKIDQYILAKCLMITKSKKDSLCVYHAYVYDENETVLIFSVSDFRDDCVDKNFAGRANKFLHYKDMLLFKEMGLLRFDWGNISDPDNFNGIDLFKLSFGGSIEKKYNILLGRNLIGKLFVYFYNRKKGLTE